RKDPRRRDTVLAHRAHEALDEHGGLAAARARRDEQRLAAARDGPLLLGGELSRRAGHQGSARHTAGYMQPPLNAHVRGRALSSPRAACAAPSRAAAVASSSSARTSADSRASSPTHSSCTPDPASSTPRARRSEPLSGW